MIIGLLGRKRAGKDTVAARLVEKHGFARYAFADALKKVLADVNPIVWAKDDGPPGRVSDLLDWGQARDPGTDGWEYAKNDPEVRRLLQELGVAIRRLDTDFWLRQVMGRVTADTRPVVITDVRFENEAEAVQAAGGVLVRVIRPGRPEDEADQHISEWALADYPTDYELLNDSTVEHLHSLVDDLVANLPPLAKRNLVLTEEDLRELGVNARIEDVDGDVWVRHKGGRWESVGPLPFLTDAELADYLPGKVLARGNEK